jgi:pyruvate dehydrogenase E1 component
VIAATDYIKQYAHQVSDHMPSDYYCLGTDGFGRSDTRARLRYFFEVNADYIVFTSVSALYRQGKLSLELWKQVQVDCGIDPNKPNPMTQ